jgi:hypothetical protein
MVDRALTDLGYLSGREQAQVIRYCLEHGESVSRDKVYELTKRDAGKMLRGFTRPVTRVVGGLKDEGVIPSGAPELLVAGYKRGSGAAARFSVPREWREAYNRAA